MKIKEVSEKLNISTHAIRYYEKIGVIKPQRTENRYREYTDTDVFNIMLIQTLQYVNFELKEIKTIINSFYKPASKACNEEINNLFNNKVIEINQKIKNYQNITRLLKEVPLASSHEAYEKHIESYHKKVYEIVLETYRIIEKDEKK